MTTSQSTPLCPTDSDKPVLAVRSSNYVPFIDIENMPLPPLTPAIPSPSPPPFPLLNPPPPPHFPPNQEAIVSSPLSQLGKTHVRLRCRYCRSEIESSVEKKPSQFAWVSVGVIALCGGIFGCCLIPLCMDSCMDTYHSCPNCGAQLGTYRAF
ncbi:unnamed protein product [Orchesella dallaii]|uniref:LITAF domain-containing protein n=1 Tax=Orchesella dallaii TaxID=48710 RepID=A0ABP1R0G7_9HEXA